MRQQDNRQYQRRSGDYVEGNTVKKMQAQPRRKDKVHQELLRQQAQEQERRERIHREYIKQREEERKRQKRQRESRAAARKNRERALQISPGYVLFLTGAMAVMVAVFAFYIKLQSELNSRMKTVTALETEVLDLKNDNDAIQKKINSSIDLDHIRQKAMDELGMVYPQKEQIEYFNVDRDDYMNQYEDIPER